MNGFEIIQVITLIVATLLLSATFGVQWIVQRIEHHDADQRRRWRRDFYRD
jgi:hypothetical protein